MSLIPIALPAGAGAGSQDSLGAAGRGRLPSPGLDLARSLRSPVSHWNLPGGKGGG